MFLWSYKKNYLKIITKYASLTIPLFMCFTFFCCIHRGETESTGGEPYSAHDITEALNETADSRGDTTMEGEITQDSVAM